MEHIAVIPGLIAMTILTVIAGMVVWLNHRDHKR